MSETDRRTAIELAGMGGSRTVGNLVNTLLEAGCSVEVVTLDPSLAEPLELEGSHLRILAGPYRQRPRHRALDLFRAERRQVERLLSMTSAPVVHANWTCEFALGALAAGRPTVVTARDAPLTILRYMPDAYRAVRALMSVGTRLRLRSLTANSPYLAAAWRRQMLYRRAIAVIPNIVAPVAGSVDRSGESLPPRILDVTDVGRRKNVTGLLRAMKLILGSHPDAGLRIAGNGLTPGSEPARLAEDLGLGHAVAFLGYLDTDRLREEYSSATVFAHASLEESFGMTVAEAMSHGLPVIGGSRAGAIPWVLDGGRAGLLADSSRPVEIAHAVCRLLDDARLRARIGKAGRNRVETAFSPARLGPEWLETYDRLARKG
ncbi:MAG: glycosyltransferase family 4 protein [Solirubrobacterales bacterium]